MKQAAGILIIALVLAAPAAAGDPHASARADLLRCRAALKLLDVARLSKQAAAAQLKPLGAAKKACAVSAALKQASYVNSGDQGLSQAYDAQVGMTDGLLNFGKYVGDIAAGEAGHAKILNYAVAEITQSKILLDDALTQLK